jgi:hypothetical protein
MSTISRLKRACHDYLVHKPEHRFGFCYWARAEHRIEEAHDALEPFVIAWKYEQGHELGYSCYVDDVHGYTEQRAEFVKWLRFTLEYFRE